MSQTEEIDIKTADGASRAWMFRRGLGKKAAVLLYTDAFGVRPSMRQVAERLSYLGFFVLLPNVFYRAGDYPPFDIKTVWNVAPERDRLMTLIHSLTTERVAIDGGAYLDVIAAQGDVMQDRVGVLGYCMGGRMAFLTAGQYPERVRAAASFHGGGLVTDGPASPHLLADRVKASLYFGVADSDASCTPAHQGVLASALGASHVPYSIELYKEKKHGFAVADHAAAYDPDAADRHWRRIESFFGETLR